MCQRTSKFATDHWQILQKTVIITINIHLPRQALWLLPILELILQTVGTFPWMRRSACSKGTSWTGLHTNTDNVDIHPSLEWNSNPCSQCSSGWDISYPTMGGTGVRRTKFTFLVISWTSRNHLSAQNTMQTHSKLHGVISGKNEAKLISNKFSVP
jgi:hypothetical protein